MSIVPPRGRPRTLLVLALGLVACADDPVLAPTLNADRSRPPTDVESGVVMQGLHSPRGLAWSPDGSLYVVEAGRPVVSTSCVQVARGLTCANGTGSVSRLRNGRQERVVTGLPAVFMPVLLEIAGPHDIGFNGMGNAWIAVGFGGDPALRAALGSAGEGLGHLVRLLPDGSWTIGADISGFERAANPDGRFIDSNPYGLLVEPGRRFVTDAGGNSLVEVDADGAMSLVATFPRVPVPPPFGLAEAVPTSVQRGPDGALYVGTLTGVPFLAGAAAIYRVEPGAAPTVHAGGFKTIIDFSFGPDGSLYVLQYASGPVFFGGPGSLVRVAPDGTRTTLRGDLTNPASVLVAPDGAIYVSNRTLAPGAGEVLRIVP
jgi:sugar lactone lactonase YvrE